MMRRRVLHQEVERPREAAGSDLAVTVLASFSIAVPLLFYLHQHVEMLRYGYEIEALEQRKVALVERHRELMASRDQSSSLGRAEEQATAAGLVPCEAVTLDAVGGPDVAASAEAVRRTASAGRTPRVD